MRLFLFLLMWGLWPTSLLLAQPADVILRTDGTETPALVLAVGLTQVTYRSGPDTLTVPRAEVFLIRYANGTKELLEANTTPDRGPLAGLSLMARQQRGRTDARQHYRANAAFAGALGTTLVFSVLGGALSTACIATVPIEEHNLRMPNAELTRDDRAYSASYRTEAQRIKRRRSWAGYAAGAGAQLLLMGMIVSKGY